jgi:uncharacterized membrane protein YgcG
MMGMKRAGFAGLALVAMVAGFTMAPVGAAGAKAKLQSQWKDRDVRMVGNLNAWGQFVPVTQNSHFAVSLYNNQNFLYVSLRTSDLATRLQLFESGLIVWLDAQGGNKERFGIQYPLGALDYGFPQRGGGRDGLPGANDGAGNAAPRPQNPDAMWEEAVADGRLDTIEVLGPGKDDRRRLTLGKVDGMAAKIWSLEGVVTYQLQVPLRASSELPYGIGAAPGAVIGFGLTTPEIKAGRGDLPMGRRGGGDGGGRGGGGRGGGGRGGGGRGGGAPRGGGGGRAGRGAFAAMRPIRDWTTMHLAAGL